MSITVDGPDGSSVDFPDGTDAATIHGVMAQHFAPDIGTDRAATVAALRGIPIAGAYTDKAAAALNAAAQPLLETGLSHKGSFSERYAENQAQIKAAADAREREHPIETTIEKMALGTAATAPAMMAAPAAFGLTGTLGTMATRGAISNAGLSGVDALARGEDVGKAAVEGGLVGGALPVVARGAGKAIQAVKDWRNPVPLTHANVERIGGAEVPTPSQDPDIQSQQEIMRKGAAGPEAERFAKASDDAVKAKISQATENIANPMGLPPSSATDAGEAVRAELAAQEQARQAAETAQGLQVDAQGNSLARDLGGGAAPVTPFDAAEGTGAAVAARRNEATARTKAAYEARDAQPGTWDPSLPQGMAEDIRSRLYKGDDPLVVGPETEATTNRALAMIDRTVGRDSGLFENAAARPVGGAAKPLPVGAAPAVDDTVAALRAKFGDGVADAYANQAGKKVENPHSLLQFIASKGGIKPDQELNAIGLGPGHRVQIPGQPGFFSAVKKNGMDLDQMRESAEEAGYFRGHGEATSTPTEFLDAVDAELRGQKRYPEGFEGHKTAGEKTAMGAREAHENAAINRGFEDDLHAAGHGELGPDVKERAVSLMREEGMHPDDAVEHALSQLDQEDAARAARPRASDFPGDRGPTGAAPAADRPITLREMDKARQQLGKMFALAKSKAMVSGDKSDMWAMSRILHEFDNVIDEGLKAGKFSGDAELAKELQAKARASHSEYKKTFSSEGPGDEVGRAVEKILGRYEHTKATAEDIQKMSYGPENRPGTGNSVKVGLRLQKILGENSPEFGRWKSGLFKYVDDKSLPAIQRAQRIDEFLDTSLGRSGVLKPHEVEAMRAYSKNLRASAPSKEPLTALQKDLRQISGADGNRMTVDQVTGKLLEKGSENLLIHLKDAARAGAIKHETWDKIRRGVLDHVLNAPEGYNEFTALAKSKRLSDFLRSGKSDILLTSGEKAELGKLASVYKRMVPLAGTTNPSGTAPMLTKIAKKAAGNLMTMLGLATHGPAGAIAGHGLDRVGAALKDARAGKEAVRLFYGPQARRTVSTPRLPIAIAASAIPAAQR